MKYVVAEAKFEGIENENEIVDHVAELVNFPDNMGRTCAIWAVYSGYMKEKQVEQFELELRLAEEQVKSRKVFYKFCMMVSGNMLYP